MHFALRCLDKPDGLALRQQTRPDHLAYLERHAQHVLVGGPLLDGDGATPIGSLLIVDFEDRAAVDRFVADDPYTKAGLFADVDVTPWRKVVPKD